ncbi:MAG: hypothetical protein Q8P21_00935 [bacterium]|nr:hypothetical protein [bacterium]
MSLVQEILYTVSNYPGGYRIIYDILYDGKPPGQKDKSFDRNLRSTLSRLKKNGLLKNTKRTWAITSEGEEFINGKNSDIKKFFPSVRRQTANVSKNLIIIFDIPEKKRRYRDWLRSELINFDFEQIQKSVWFGPPLPKEFVEYLGESGLLRFVRFFKVSEKDLI